MLERRVASRLPDAAVDDLLIPSYSYLVETLYDVDCVERIVRHFLEGRGGGVEEVDEEGSEAETPGREASRRAMLAVGRLMDAYLGEIATDANLKTDKFCDLAWALPDGARVYDDGLYRAVDIYIKVSAEHILNAILIDACSAMPVLTSHRRRSLCRHIQR